MVGYLIRIFGSCCCTLMTFAPIVVVVGVVGVVVIVSEDRWQYY